MTGTGKTGAKSCRAGKPWEKNKCKDGGMMTWLHRNNLDQSCLFISDSKQSIFLDDISGEKPKFILYLRIEMFGRRRLEISHFRNCIKTF